jgi:hypothetical protein
MILFVGIYFKKKREKCHRKSECSECEMGGASESTIAENTSASFTKGRASASTSAKDAVASKVAGQESASTTTAQEDSASNAAGRASVSCWMRRVENLRVEMRRVENLKSRCSICFDTLLTPSC